MKKDINFLKSENVYLAAIQQWNDDFKENMWYVYLINNTPKTLEMILVVSRAYGIINNEQRTTGTLRHSFKDAAANSILKIEMLENSVLQLNNEFLITYFLDNKVYEKSFIFNANTIDLSTLTDVPETDLKGILLK